MGRVKNMNEETGTLYHYCSLSTFYSIMKNRSIWLSDVSKSNDSKELVWATRQCKYFVLNKFLEYVERMKANDWFIDTKFIEFSKTFEKLESIDTGNSLKAWAFCLSEKGDNLGQWRGYADDGRGISIGFNKEYFIIQTQSLGFSPDKVCHIFDQIEYGDFDISNLLRPEDVSILSFSCDYDEIEKCFKRLMAYSIMLAPMYKNEAFKEEKEWRMVLLAHTSALANGLLPCADNVDKLDPKFKIVNYTFTPRNNTLVSHIEVAMTDMKSAIKSITIGPKSNLSELDVKLFLISSGLLESAEDTSIKVTRSSSSYR